jgi:ribosomal protein S18 acetylase RimI-like enzyme
MLAPGLVIRRATLHDAAALTALGARTFADTFGAANTPEDLRLYLANTYAEPLQQAELTNRDMLTLVVEDGAQPIAFAQIRRGSAPACVALPSPVEIWRFYVDRPWHGRDVAKPLMDATLAAARALGGQSVWLSVWERNPRAIAFYAKHGFADVGCKVFVLGTDHQTDRVMARQIATSPFI